METKPAQQNIQDSFLNTARKEKAPITIYLLSGAKPPGPTRPFDKPSAVLDTKTQDHLIFRPANSRWAPKKGSPPGPRAAGPAPTAGGPPPAEEYPIPAG